MVTLRDSLLDPGGKKSKALLRSRAETGYPHRPYVPAIYVNPACSKRGNGLR